ncbi:MAG: PEP-CTERM sorting domain-containing protein [Roseibacillus sp.]
MKATCLPLAAALFSISPSIQGAVIYSENADGLTAGSSTLGDSSADWGAPAGDYGVVAGGSVFATNHFTISAPDANFNFANWVDGVTTRSLVTVSLDVADTGGGGTNADAGLRLAHRRSTGSAFATIISTALTDNTIFHYDFIINTGASAALYEDGVTSIAANTIEVWIDGVLASSGTAGGSGDTIGVGLWSRRPDNAILGDNIVIRDTAFFAPVPEPSSFALLGLGGLGLLVRRRR